MADERGHRPRLQGQAGSGSETRVMEVARPVASSNSTKAPFNTTLSVATAKRRG